MLYISQKTEEIYTPCCEGNGKYVIYELFNGQQLYICNECEKVADSLTDVIHSIYVSGIITHYFSYYLNIEFSRDLGKEIRTLKSTDINISNFPYQYVNETIQIPCLYYMKIQETNSKKLILKLYNS